MTTERRQAIYNAKQAYATCLYTGRKPFGFSMIGAEYRAPWRWTDGNGWTVMLRSNGALDRTIKPNKSF